MPQIFLSLKDRLEEPKEYAIILYNDDVTTFEFVIELLKQVFQKTFQEAMQIAIKVDQEGSTIVGVFPYDIAQTRLRRANRMILSSGFPLRIEMQEC